LDAVLDAFFVLLLVVVLFGGVPFIKVSRRTRILLGAGALVILVIMVLQSRGQI
jgi:hypothetical protein